MGRHAAVHIHSSEVQRVAPKNEFQELVEAYSDSMHE